MEIFTDIETLNLSNNSQVDLFIAPTVQVSKFANFTSNTLSSLSSTLEIFEKIKEQNPAANISLNTTPFQIQIQDGKALLKIPKSYNIQNITSAYVFINSNRYLINVKSD